MTTYRTIRAEKADTKSDTVARRQPLVAVALVVTSCVGVTLLGPLNCFAGGGLV
jgi:hypothetical protein